jgi:hypothetical protein
MRFLTSIILFYMVGYLSSCIGVQNTHIYKAKSGVNTPYEDDKANNKTLRQHLKKAKKRQTEIDEINHKYIEPSKDQSPKAAPPKTKK